MTKDELTALLQVKREGQRWAIADHLRARFTLEFSTPQPPPQVTPQAGVTTPQVPNRTLLMNFFHSVKLSKSVYYNIIGKKVTISRKIQKKIVCS